jgi:hypothetical protein
MKRMKQMMTLMMIVAGVAPAPAMEMKTGYDVATGALITQIK